MFVMVGDFLFQASARGTESRSLADVTSYWRQMHQAVTPTGPAKREPHAPTRSYVSNISHPTLVGTTGGKVAGENVRLDGMVRVGCGSDAKAAPRVSA